ncbi:PIN domain-containing protein [Brevundimonas sp.]|uniref:PIN domain-containing protein n=1 Tax=Brevundimonas sp. TaxID=1871086 RepID=UPI0025BC2920|nr:PIN domain-containing protein [Brevundimonas sp.]
MYLLDTNAVSAMVREPAGAIGVRVDLVGRTMICTSVVVAAELRYGLAKRKSARLTSRVEAVLESLVVIPFGSPAEAIYGMIRADIESRGRTIGQMDLLIAAHALALDCILVTDNDGEFRRVPGLRVENWLREG